MTITITSKALAATFMKDHKAVLRDIRKLFKDMNINPAEFADTYVDDHNRKQPMFKLNHAISVALIARYPTVSMTEFNRAWVEADARQKAEAAKKSAGSDEKLVVDINKATIAADLFNRILIECKLFKIPEQVAYVEAVSQVRNRTSVDYSSWLLLSPVMNDPVNPALLDTSDLADHYGVGIEHMNSLLEENNFQQLKDGKYIPVHTTELVSITHNNKLMWVVDKIARVIACPFVATV